MIRIGEWNELKVLRLKEFGVYLSDEDNTEDVLLPIKQVPKGSVEGTVINVFIYRDSQDRLIATTNTPLITMGEIVKLHVKSVTSIGAFMDWGLEKDILLPFKEQTAKVEEGRSYLVRMYVDKSGRLCVSMKLYGYLMTNDIYEKGSAVTATVYDYRADLGAFVAIDDKYHGMVHVSEIYNKIYVGDVITCRVIECKEDGKTDLSLRNLAHVQINEDSEMVFSIIESYNGTLPFNDKADKDLIKREFGLSKNAFKRAVGRLLKEGKIEITEKNIIIKEDK